MNEKAIKYRFLFSTHSVYKHIVYAYNALYFPFELYKFPSITTNKLR